MILVFYLVVQHDTVVGTSVRILLYPLIAFAYLMLHTSQTARLAMPALATIMSIAWNKGRTYQEKSTH